MSTDTPSKLQLESEIQELRLELGETVEALSRRLDVKARMQEQARRIPVVPVAVAVAAVVVLVVWKKRS
ncbi:MAG TPA: DUF3618 domain-containing protein [Nocardioidaceae bacterium]|nr:DUF3618 domain-containing protein [Nocardioidaceae bacterium]